jgi:gamma-glutamylcyclotransferase (GGCT)/AIG2-like uncharacterized protein YtfP
MSADTPDCEDCDVDQPGPAPAYLAVYGALMSGYDTLERLGVADQLRLVGPCRIGGRLYDLGEWPTLVPGAGVAHGELFELLDERAFARLDEFEDYDPSDRGRSGYLRDVLTLIDPAVSAWVYVANGPPDGAVEIPGGSWYEWRTRA